jgi:tRNA pseudouridine32 synthase/23S rRNA pseudouridine746 synthase
MAQIMAKPTLVLHHNDLVIVHKPAGVPFHHTSSTQPGILHLLRQSQAEGCFPAGRLYPVHRLDTVTSGLLAFATSSSAARHLVGLFRERKVQKYYIALSCRPPKKKMGTVSGDMTASRRGAYKLLHTSEDPAITRFWSTGLPTVRPGMRLYIVKPETGRTHQIRVALKSLGAPIVGDQLYAAAADAKQEDRTYLHAAAIRLAMGSDIVQAVWHPKQGSHFLHAGCVAALNQALPEALQGDTGRWFSSNKLLMSDLGSQQSSQQLQHAV